MFKCTHCDKEFTRDDNRKRHELIHQRVPQASVNPEPAERFTTCTICNRPVAANWLKRHCINLHSPYTVPICEDYTGIINPHQKPKQCPHCDLFFLFDRQFRLHLANQHNLGKAQVHSICETASGAQTGLQQTHESSNDQHDNAQGPPAKRQRNDIPHQQVNNDAIAGSSNMIQQQQDQVSLSNGQVAGSSVQSTNPDPQSDTEICSVCNTKIAETNMDEHWQKIHNRWAAPQKSKPDNQLPGTSGESTLQSLSNTSVQDVSRQPCRQFRCSKCDKTFRSSYYLKVHMDMHTRIEASRHPQVDPRILQRHLNDSIEATCNICNKSVVLNKMADHMIETHVPTVGSPVDSSVSHDNQLNIQAQQGHGNMVFDDTVAGPSNAPSLQPQAATTVDVQQVLHDLDLETVNFDDDVFNDTVNNMKYCKYCKASFLVWERHVLTEQHKDNAQIDHSENVTALDIAFGTRIIGYRIYNDNEQNLNYNEFLNGEHALSNLTSILASYVQLHSALKFTFMLYGHYVKQNVNPDSDEDEFDEKKAIFQTPLTELMQNHDILDTLAPLFENLVGQTDEFATKGSGWALSKILYLEVHINKYSPLKGGTYIEIPPYLKAKHACYNPLKFDNECFKWVVRAYFRHEELKQEYPVSLRGDDIARKYIYREVVEMKQEVAERIDHQYGLNWSDLQFPVSFNGINDFVARNETISITVYGVSPEDNKTIVGPLFRSNEINENHIHMLLLEEGGRNHFCLIKDLSRLLGGQLGGRQIHREICQNCFAIFNHHQDLLSHQDGDDCHGVATYLPDPGTKMQFENHQNEIMAPINCYADFESVLKPVEGCENAPESRNSIRTFHHVPSSYGFLITYATDPSQDYYEEYRGEDCTKRFVENLYAKLKTMFEDLVLNNAQPMTYTAADKARFDRQQHCHICKGFIVGRKVRDHDHQTGKFRGAACDNCNKHYYLSKEVSVFFHNLSKYDAHLFIQDLAKLDGKNNIEIIPSTDETYISFMKPVEIIRNHNPCDPTSHDKVYLKVRFKDSFRFFPGSLQAQAANLQSSQYIKTERFLSDKYDLELIELLKRKGVFPYEHIKSFDNYEETKLPPKEAFSISYDGQTKELISDEDYQHALNVYQRAGCQNLGEYNDLYLKTDVLILADVFENFRKICMRPDTYGLDPVHYYTLPGFSWDAMLKHTRVKLELLSDLKMVNFFNKGIRGGLVQCSHRYAEANNPHISTYDESKDESYIMYFDVNNLYGWAMCHPLPIDEFSWMSDDEIEQLTSEKILSIPDDNYHGYVLQVDLEYPVALHDKHNDLPFCPGSKKFGCTKKLCATLESKEKYIIHYYNLKQAIKNGLVLKKVHKVLQFHQSKWLEAYIQLNNNLRTNATTAAEKDLFKLMNNSIFGKSVENVKKRRNIYLCSSWESQGQRRGAESYIASGYCKRIKVFNDSLVAVELKQKYIRLNKPIYVGFAVLEISKTRMYEFHYNFMTRQFPEPDQLRLCYTDTDSLIYYIKTENYYEQMKPIIHQNYEPGHIKMFDTSNYGNKHGYNSLNKKVLGAMKDETSGEPITLLIAIRPKAYYFETESLVTNKAKGVVKKVAEKLSKDDYLACLNNREMKIIRTMRTFRSDHHQIYNETVKKTALSGGDDKRIILEDGVNTLAYGHYLSEDLTEIEEDFVNFFNNDDEEIIE